MNKISRMLLIRLLALYSITFAVCEEYSNEEDRHYDKLYYDNLNISISQEIQMDGNMNPQHPIPLGLNPASTFCTFIPYRILNSIKSFYADNNETKDSEDSPLHRAAKLGRTQEVALLLSSGANASSVGVFKRTPLHWAASNGFLGVTMILITKGALINSKDKWGYTPLQLAVDKGHIECVEILIKNRAETNTKDIDGRTPLHDAARNGYFNIIPLLIKNTVNESAIISKPFVSTPLHEATIGNHYKIVEYLIIKKFNLNAMDEMKRTPLHWAVFYNYEEITLLLISKRAGLNRKDCHGLSPLHLSSMKGYKILTEILIKNGAFKNSRSRNGHTPLHKAARNGQKEIVELLIKEGAELEKSGSTASDGSTPLFEAVEGGYSDIVEILINNGARFNVTNSMGKTPLHRAIEQDNKDIVNLLVHKGADISVEDYRGYTPYAVACENGNMEILQELFVYCICYNYTKNCQCVSVNEEIMDLPLACQCITAKRNINTSAKTIKPFQFDKCPCLMIKRATDEDYEQCTTVEQLEISLKNLCHDTKTTHITYNHKKTISCPLKSHINTATNSTVCLGHIIRFTKNTIDNSIIFH